MCAVFFRGLVRIPTMRYYSFDVVHSLLSPIKIKLQMHLQHIEESVECKIDIRFSRAEIVWLQAARGDTQLIQFALVTFTKNEMSHLLCTVYNLLKFIAYECLLASAN